MALDQSPEEIAAHEKELDQFKMTQYSLAGKVAVITGGNTGLGQGYAVAMAEAGADIFIPTFGKDEWDNTRRLIEKRGRKVEFADVNLTEPGVTDKVVAEAVEKMGHIDILVNNAGMIRRNPLLESKDKDWDQVIAINLTAVYHMSPCPPRRSLPSKSTARSSISVPCFPSKAASSSRRTPPASTGWPA